ncbi:hypothetical protein Tco_1530480, partial [Tanacetum coccineum]
MLMRTRLPQRQTAAIVLHRNGVLDFTIHFESSLIHLEDSPSSDHALVSPSVFSSLILMITPKSELLEDSFEELRGSPSAFHQEVTIKDSIEVGYQASIDDGDVRSFVRDGSPKIEEVEEETRTLTSRLETTETERTALRDRVRSLKLSDPSLCDTLRIEREIFCSSTSFGNEGDNENGNGGGNGNGHGNRNGGGKGNRNRGGNENGNDNNNIGMETTGIEGAVGLVRWFKKMESMFHI